MSFRINAKAFFLTYPRSDFDCSEYIIWLTEKLPDIVEARVSSEQHNEVDKEGCTSLHRHVCFRLSKKLNLRKENFFDYKGFHPNIQAAKHFKKAWNYCGKDGEVFDYVSEISDTEEETTDVGNPVDFDSEMSWLTDCLQNKIPFGYAKRIWDISRVQPPTAITSPHPDAVVRADLDEIERGADHYNTIINGPTGIGKTTWATKNMPTPILLVSHIDDLRRFNPTDHKSILFDDMSFEHMPIQAQIHILDHDYPRSIHCRYGVATIPAKTVKVFTFSRFQFSSDPQILRRISSIITLS